MVTILSDQLTVRGYCANEAWVPGPIVVQNVNTNAPDAPKLNTLGGMQSVDMSTNGAILDPILASLVNPTEPKLMA